MPEELEKGWSERAGKSRGDELSRPWLDLSWTWLISWLPSEASSSLGRGRHSALGETRVPTHPPASSRNANEAKNKCSIASD